MTQTETPVVWQRVPQGWIELAAFAIDDIADRWWQAYLAPAIGSVDSDTIALMTRAFASAREAVRDTPYAVAGIFPYLVDEPTVFFIGTAILPAPEDARTARTVSGLTGLVRFTDDPRTEPFIALDGRAGSATLGIAVLEDGTSVAAITGEVPLAVSPATSTAEATPAGTVFVVALSLDPNRLDELVPYAALALDSTRLLSADEMPAPYPPEDRLVATDAED